MKINNIQQNVVELKVLYDDYHNYTFSDKTKKVVVNENNICGIGNNFNQNRTCNLTFTTTEYLNPPILIHYELRNFHQNHRNYFKSRDPKQLLGEMGEQDPISKKDCKLLNKLGNIKLNPCGLIANTLFNDYFTLLEGKDAYGNDLFMNEEGITWQSDIKYKYAQPYGFESSKCPNNTCDASCCNANDSCTTPYFNKKDGQCYRYFYPEDATTQYLYETYPDIISPIEGVMNEHFMVWMRIAVLPNFRKLYGWIDQPIAANTTLVFQVNANYVVTRFQGGKALVVGTTSIFGGKSKYMAQLFIGVGAFCLVAGALFSIKHFIFPRKLADPKYLHFKEE
jgi:LEM3 (ligand-effect modulator 3) family / CDC50 family